MSHLNKNTNRHADGYLGESLFDDLEASCDDAMLPPIPLGLLDEMEALRRNAVAIVALDSKANQHAMASFSTIFGDGKQERRERFSGFDPNSDGNYGGWLK